MKTNAISAALMAGSLMVLFVAATAPFARSQEDGIPDYELAQSAVEKGEIIPLADVFKRLQKPFPGKITEVELEYSNGRRVYEVELVTDDGRLIEVDMDAATGKVLESEEEDTE